MRKIEWEDNLDISLEVRDLIEKLLTQDVEQRLGSKGATDVKSALWFKDVDWENLLNQKVQFLPVVKNIEDTDYFDSRGVQKIEKLSDSDEENGENQDTKAEPISENASSDFGEAVYKNLPLLEKANRKMMNIINSEFPNGDEWLQKRRESLPNHPVKLSTSSNFSKNSIPRNHSNLQGITEKRNGNSNESISLQMVNSNSISENNIHKISPQSSKNFNSDNNLSGSYFDLNKGFVSGVDKSKNIKNSKGDLSLDSIDDSLHMNSFAAPLKTSFEVLISNSDKECAKYLESLLTPINYRCNLMNSDKILQAAMEDFKYDLIFLDDAGND